MPILNARGCSQLFHVSLNWLSLPGSWTQILPWYGENSKIRNYWLQRVLPWTKTKKFIAPWLITTKTSDDSPQNIRWKSEGPRIPIPSRTPADFQRIVWGISSEVYVTLHWALSYIYISAHPLTPYFVSDPTFPKARVCRSRVLKCYI